MIADIDELKQVARCRGPSGLSPQSCRVACTGIGGRPVGQVASWLRLAIGVNPIATTAKVGRIQWFRASPGRVGVDEGGVLSPGLKAD